MPLQSIFPPRSPFVYPAGATPGFDPTHPAAAGLSPGYAMSAVALGNNYVNLLTGRALTVGSPPTAAITSLGPSPLFTGVASVSASGFPASSPSAGTYALMVMPQTVAAGDHTLFQTGVVVDFNSTFQIYNAGYVNSGLTPVANVPYFIVVSVKGAGAVNFLLCNLSTGVVQTAVSSTGNAVSQNTTYFVGNPGGQISLCYIAAVMFSPIFLSVPQLRQWAMDPWAFWYPRLTLGNSLPAIALPPTGIGYTLPIGRVH